MRNGSKTAFRPSLERFEGRIVATAGVTSAVHHAAAHVEPQHAPPRHEAPAKTPAHAEPAHPKAPKPASISIPKTTAATVPRAVASPAPAPIAKPSTSLPTNTSSNQAWVEIDNTTGETIQYYIKLGPYDNGQFIPFDIGPGQTQLRYSSLISDGQRVKADFAIQFGNGPITPLMTGTSQGTAQGYYIFLDGNLQPYVAPYETTY